MHLNKAFISRKSVQDRGEGRGKMQREEDRGIEREKKTALDTVSE